MVYRSSLALNSDGFIVESGGNVMTHAVSKDEVKDLGINVNHSGTNFSHRFVVPAKQLGTFKTGLTTFHIELIPPCSQSILSNSPDAEIYQQQAFNEAADGTIPTFLITHLKFPLPTAKQKI